MPKTSPIATQETTPLKDIYDLAIHLDEIINKMQCYLKFYKCNLSESMVKQTAFNSFFKSTQIVT
jgi:hypothetical protein